MKPPATLPALTCLWPLPVQAELAADMKITSPVFSEGGMIPRGSPVMGPTPIPGSTSRLFRQGQGLVLIVDDPGAPEQAAQHSNHPF
jgi:hypothetical protein